MEATAAVSHLSKSFGAFQAVKDVSFEVYAGEIFGLLGPNGAGKTTSIRMMLDIFRADGGTVTIFGGPMTEEKKNRIGYLPEDRGLYQDLKLAPTLVYLASLKGVPQGEASARLDQWLRRLDLYDHRDKKVQELSKGMQQKAQIITALIHDPDLIVIDEPFSGLDPVNTRLVKDIIEEQRAAGKAIIMSTHQMYQVEALCTRIVLINQGNTVLYGAVDDIKRDFAGNAITLEGQGDFTSLPGILEARRHNGAWHLALAPGTSPQDVFHALAAQEGVKIERFEIAEPSLDDIFINVVKAGQGADGDREDALRGGAYA
ncbi:MAG: ATP-binding cassette domain-containing protein [Anaerolineae bacterium]|nr:ATP-binding cassette domain-containing protein [Anaerolineae bacterium]